MPTFHPPKYSKIVNTKTGQPEPCYRFVVESSESDNKLAIFAEESLSVLDVEKALRDNTEWWNGWIAQFLEASAKHFSKPYTVQQIHKITKHHLSVTEDTVFPVNVFFHPHAIQIHGGIFGVEWHYETIPVTIEIPDVPEEETLPVSSSESVQEMNPEEVPVDPNATEESLVLMTPNKDYEKHKVKEARLKAKIAMYRAQYQMNKYYEKYGTDVTDSDTEASDEEEEEIQL